MQGYTGMVLPSARRHILLRRQRHQRYFIYIDLSSLGLSRRLNSDQVRSYCEMKWLHTYFVVINSCFMLSYSILTHVNK
jgi:hypothetical protein